MGRHLETTRAGRHLKPRAGHTPSLWSAHGSAFGRPPSHRLTETTDLPANSAVLLWPLRTAGPGRIEQLLFLGPQSHRVAHPPYFLPLLKRYSPLPRGNKFPPARRSPPRAPMLSFSSEVLATAEQTFKTPGSMRWLSPQTFGGPHTHSQPTFGVLAGVHPNKSLKRLCPPQCHPLTLSRERGLMFPSWLSSLTHSGFQGVPLG